MGGRGTRLKVWGGGVRAVGQLAGTQLAGQSVVKTWVGVGEGVVGGGEVPWDKHKQRASPGLRAVAAISTAAGAQTG